MNPLNFFIALFLLISNFLAAQLVTTLAEVTANGGVSVDVDGYIYAAHFGPLPIVGGLQGRNIYKISPDGIVSLFVDGELNVGSGNNFDSQGFLYQSNFLGNNIIKIAADGAVVDPNFATVTGPVGITVIENDVLVVCECSTNTVKKITQNGEVSILASGDSFACVNGITQDEAGNFYTTNFGDGRITKITPAGSTSTIGATPLGNGHITFRAKDQHFYIASYSTNRIFKMSLDGVVSPFAGTGAAGAMDAEDPKIATFTKPNGIEISRDGCSLYITQDENVIREIKFTDSVCASAQEVIMDAQAVVIYPNPTPGQVIVENKSTTEFHSITVWNSDGKMVRQLEAAAVLDLSTLSAGVYLLKMLALDGKIIVKQVVVRK